MDFTSTKRLGPYELIAQVGAGGMGEVYKARDPRLSRSVAIKIITGSVDAERLNRFEQEARAAGMLNHPNILAIHDIGNHEGVRFIVSELLEGESLRDRLGGGPLSPQKAIEYARQIIAGLAAAHDKGVVHRDLKPDNIFVTKDGRVKILDFGLAKLAEPVLGEVGVDSPTTPITNDRQVIGTFAYMSPEQLQAHPIDARSDLFSFGVLLYEMLSGRSPFLRNSVAESMVATLNEEPPPLPDSVRNAYPALEPLLRHCLEKKPGERFQCAADLGYQLAHITPGGAREAAALPARPSRLSPQWLVALLALLAIAAVIAFSAGRHTATTVPPQFQQLTFRRGSILSAAFAPDSQTIVYTGLWDGNPPQLYSMRRESPESRLLNLPPATLLSMSSSGKMAISLGREHLAGLMAGGTLAEVAIEGSAARELLKDVEGAAWAPDGRNLAVVHIVDGRYQLEYPAGVAIYRSGGWISDPSVSPDGKSIAFIDHPALHDDRGGIALVPTAGGTRKSLTTEFASARGLSWNPRTNEVWFTASEVGPNAALWAMSADGGTPRLVSRDPGRLTLHDIHSDGSVLVSEGRRGLTMMLRSIPGGQDRNLSWFDSSVAAGISSDAKTILFNEQGAGSGTRSYAVFVRGADDSPATRIGEGALAALSPDRQWAAAVMFEPAPAIALLPIGAGQPRTLPIAGVDDVQSLAWFPDGKRVLISGVDASHKAQMWALAVADGSLHAIASGVRSQYYCNAISPDGRQLVAINADDRAVLLASSGGAAKQIDELEAGDVPLSWAADGHSFFYIPYLKEPAQVFRFDLQTRKKELVTTLVPSDPSGVLHIVTVQITPDGKTCAYTYAVGRSELYLVSGLR